MELIFPAMVKLMKTCNIIKGIWGHFTAQRHGEPVPRDKLETFNFALSLNSYQQLNLNLLRPELIHGMHF